MKCTISPRSIVLGFLKGKKSKSVLDFVLIFKLLLEMKSQNGEYSTDMNT